MSVPADVLLKGAWYAVEQCGLLLQHAVLLHGRKAYSSAVALALLAREELGRCRILLDFWSKAEKDHFLHTVQEIRAACDDHEEKQCRAQLSITYRADGDTRLAELLRARIKYAPGTSEYQRAIGELKKIDEMILKRTPGARHSTRMRAFYVDVNDSGTGWNRPCEMTSVEATNCLTDAVND